MFPSCIIRTPPIRRCTTKSAFYAFGRAGLGLVADPASPFDACFFARRSASRPARCCPGRGGRRLRARPHYTGKRRVQRWVERETGDEGTPPAAATAARLAAAQTPRRVQPRRPAREGPETAMKSSPLRLHERAVPQGHGREGSPRGRTTGTGAWWSTGTAWLVYPRGSEAR